MTKLKKRVPQACLLIGIYLSQNWINFFYTSPRNPDFSKYYDYINYFLGLDVEIDYGQNSLYYFLISQSIKNKFEILTYANLEIVISFSVQNVNFIFYIIGLCGLFKFLEHKQFSKNVILLSLTLLCFFPQLLISRTLMKPEILAFGMIGWTIFYFEKYLQTYEISNLYKSLPFFLIMLNSKASIAGIVAFYLLISYFDIFKKLFQKEYLILFFIILFCILLIQVENYFITGNYFNERVYEEEYDNKAPFDILFKFDYKSLISNPLWVDKTNIENYNKNANSVLNILLLDTFGDYFDQYFGSQLFKSNRKDLFVDGEVELINKNRQIRYNGPLSGFLVYQLDYVRKYVAIIFSFAFYILLIFYSIKNKEHKKYLILPLMSGVFVLYVNSLGIPSNNFNPFKGDTFKPFYFSFLLAISFVFISCILLERFKKFRFLIICFFISSIFFIGGHPKAVNQAISEGLIVKNEFSSFCEINNIFIFDNYIFELVHKNANLSNIKSDCNEFGSSKKILNKKFLREDVNQDYYKKCINDGSISKEHSNKVECRMFSINEIRRTSDLPTPLYPYFSITVLFLSILILIIELLEQFNINIFLKSRIHKMLK